MKPLNALDMTHERASPHVLAASQPDRSAWERMWCLGRFACGSKTSTYSSVRITQALTETLVEVGEAAFIQGA
jgi:hypothetical protein